MPQVFAFKYLRADRQEVELGPFLTKTEANRAKKVMEDMGAICGAAYPANISKEEFEALRTGDKSWSFKTYLRRELDVLKVSAVDYHIIYPYICELEKRIRRFVRHHSLKKYYKGLPREIRQKEFKARIYFLQRVSTILSEESNSYSPLDGSVPESIGKLLLKLSKEFLQRI